MTKLLFISNISNRVTSFAIASITVAHKLKIDFYQAANWSDAKEGQIEKDQVEYDIKINHVDISRSPFSKSNIIAYKQIVELIEKENIDYIHCNTPVGGLLGRLAGKKCKVKKVIYQAHGFHFYDGAPKKNWMIYYPIEKLLAHKTDAIITINQEDFERAKKFRLKKGGRVYYVHGVGIDVSAFGKELPSSDIRKELGIGSNELLLISAGELNANKNNRVIIEAMAKLNDSRIHYVLCGVGPLDAELKKLAEDKGIAGNVHFLGYRTDVFSLYREADVYVMPSFREGLSRSMMEAMASGLPCVASKIRGNVDLIDERLGGYLCSPSDTDGFASAIKMLVCDAELRQKMKEYNLEKIKEYDVSVVEREIEEIYREVFSET